MAKNIIISGWYGMGNVGDEAILQAMIDKFRNEFPDCKITVFSYNPTYTKENQGVNAVNHLPYGIISWLARIFYNGKFWPTFFSILKCDLFIMGGGGFLGDKSPEIPYLWLRECMFAKILGKKTVLYRIGAGPFKTQKGRNTVKFFIDNFVDKVSVRDKTSFNHLVNCAKIDKSKVTIEIDPVAQMDVSSYKIENDGYITAIYAPYFHIEKVWPNCQEKYKQLKTCFMEQVKTLLACNRKVRVVFFQPNQDNVLAEEFKQAFGDSIEIQLPPNYKDAIAILAKSQAIISFRLHGNIIAYALHKPFMPIIYSYKTKSFLGMINYKPKDILISTVDEETWTDYLPLNKEEWRNKTKTFLSLLEKNDINIFYEKNSN